MKIALFLGAGASAPLGKPTTIDFKKTLSSKIKPDSISYWFVNHYGYNDAEEVLQGIREIKDFWEGYGGQFLRHSHKLFVRDSEKKEISFDDFVNDISTLERTIHDEVFEAYRWNHKSESNLTLIYSEILPFLRESSEKIMIFTTNYDRAIEEYCGKRDHTFRCMDGFLLDKQSERFVWGEMRYAPSSEKNITNVFLHKLHGSLGWKEHVDSGTVNIERTSEESRPTDKNYRDSIIIFPTLTTKDRHQLEPFNHLREQFEGYMNKADVCIVIGFSFRDNHLKKIFRDFIAGEKKLIIISPTAESDYNNNLLMDVQKTSDGQDKTIVKAFYGDTQVHFIEMPMNPETIKEIIRDVKRIIQPEKPHSNPQNT